MGKLPYRIAFLLVLVSALAPLAKSQAEFTVPPLNEADGKSFGGIALGISTDESVKKQFKTSKGAVRPEALKLETAGNSPYRVNVLLDGRGKTAKAIGVRVDIKNEDLVWTTFSESCGEGWLIGHFETRYSDWGVAIHPTRGIIAVVHELSSNTPVVAHLIYTTEKCVLEFGKRLSKDVAPVQKYNDPYKSLDFLAEITRVDCTVNAKGVTLDDKDDVSYDIEKRTERMIDREPYINISGRANAILYVTASVDYSNSKGGEMRVSMSLSATTPYGNVSVSGNGSETLRKNLGTIRWRDGIAFMDAARDAYEMLVGELRTQLRRLIPTSGDAVSQIQVENLINTCVR